MVIGLAAFGRLTVRRDRPRPVRSAPARPLARTSSAAMAQLSVRLVSISPLMLFLQQLLIYSYNRLGSEERQDLPELITRAVPLSPCTPFVYSWIHTSDKCHQHRNAPPWAIGRLLAPRHRQPRSSIVHTLQAPNLPGDGARDRPILYSILRAEPFRTLYNI